MAGLPRQIVEDPLTGFLPPSLLDLHSYCFFFCFLTLTSFSLYFSTDLRATS